MENYQMNRSGCRPYNRTCGMMNFSPAPLSQMRRETSCSEMNCESSDCTRPYKNSGDFIPVKSSYNPPISQTALALNQFHQKQIICMSTWNTWHQQWPMYHIRISLQPMILTMPCLWALFSHSFVNHSVEREVFEDDEKAAFPKMLFFTADQWG